MFRLLSLGYLQCKFDKISMCKYISLNIYIYTDHLLFRQYNKYKCLLCLTEYSNELHYLKYKITGFNLDTLSFENFLGFF